jgi:hypothetical protein
MGICDRRRHRDCLVESGLNAAFDHFESGTMPWCSEERIYCSGDSISSKIGA